MKKSAKRGRRVKATIWDDAPSMEASLTGYNAFARRIQERMPPNVQAMYVYRESQYKAALKGGLPHREAIREANKATGERFNCSIGTVRNRIGTIHAPGKHPAGSVRHLSEKQTPGNLWRDDAKKMEAFQQQRLFPRQKLCNLDVGRLNDAMKLLLSDPAYADLKPESLAFRHPTPELNATYNVWAFHTEEAARPESPHRLASVLAAAFARSDRARAEAQIRAATAEAENRSLRQTVERLEKEAKHRSELLGRYQAQESWSRQLAEDAKSVGVRRVVNKTKIRKAR